MTDDEKRASTYPQPRDSQALAERTSDMGDEDTEALLASSKETVPIPRQRNSSLRSQYCSLWNIVCGILVIASISYNLFTLLRPPPRPGPPPGEDCSCGATPDEARAMNCRFDQLAAAWLPPHCIDAELSAEFERAGPGVNGSWEYWDAEFEPRKQLSTAQVAELGGSGRYTYASKEWHVTHCLFYWKKMVRAAEGHSVMETRYNRWGHVHHCSKTILNHLWLPPSTLFTVGTEIGIALDSRERKYHSMPRIKDEAGEDLN